MKSRRRRSIHAICVAAITCALGAPSAQAESLATTSAGCAEQKLTQPFKRFLDPAFYTLAPQGTFEKLTDWNLSGASRTLGNESFYVNSDDDRWSLALPPGSAATSPPICVGVEHPIIRLFARNAGSPTSKLRVQVLFKDVAGHVSSATIGDLDELTSGKAWAPTPQMALLVNGLALSSDNQAFIRLRFDPRGKGGDWQIDDVYVDPYRKG